jgi:DNA-binding response OmpR family regulator
MTRAVRQALVVEDEPPLRELLRLHLALAGYEVQEAGDGAEALRLARSTPYDLVVLDVMLPGLDGFSLCEAIRAQGPNIDAPILMLTARGSESDKVAGLERGADDYLTKPFGVRELLARVKAVTRRHERHLSREETATAAAADGEIVLDSSRRLALVRGQPVELTRQEFDLLHRLVTRPGMVFSRAALLEHVWNDDKYVTERTVDTVISRIRKKIELDPQEPRLLLTAWGVGYKFVEASDEPPPDRPAARRS